MTRAAFPTSWLPVLCRSVKTSAFLVTLSSEQIHGGDSKTIDSSWYGAAIAEKVFGGQRKELDIDIMVHRPLRIEVEPLYS